MKGKRKQCKKCPWLKTTNPREIPDGYCERKHADLAGTIANLNITDPHEIARGLGAKRLRIMACHESMPGKEISCAGWMNHQLGAGNNIALRLAVAFGRMEVDYVLVGEQHERFEDTLPKDMEIEK